MKLFTLPSSLLHETVNSLSSIRDSFLKRCGKRCELFFVLLKIETILYDIIGSPVFFFRRHLGCNNLKNVLGADLVAFDDSFNHQLLGGKHRYDNIE